MKALGRNAGFCVALGLSLLITACGGGSQHSIPVLTLLLTVNSTNPATGVSIGVSPADNNGAAAGTTSFTRTYDAGASVTLTAPATSGANTFSSWTGCTSTTGSTTGTVSCNVTLNGNTTVTANYAVPAPVTYTLTVNSANPASGAQIGVSPADNSGTTTGATAFTLTYNSETSVSLTAPATAGGNNFSSWTGCASASGATCTVAMNSNMTVIANYAAPAPVTYTLTVTSTNPASGAQIGVSPADSNGTATGATAFTLTYNSGTSVSLTAPATAGGNNFGSWTGCTSANGAVCTVTLNANTTVTANYANIITVNSTNPDSGVPISVTTCSSGLCPLVVTLHNTSFALPSVPGVTYSLLASTTAAGNSFSSWNGCDSAQGLLCSVASNGFNRIVTANYAAPTYTLTVNSTNPSSGVTIDYNNWLNAVMVPGVTSFALTEPTGTTLNLTAPSKAGNNSFVNWSGCTSSSGAVCTATLNGDMTVTANYAVPLYTLTINSTNPSSGVFMTLGFPAMDPPTPTQGTTSFTVTDVAGADLVITAPATASGNNFSSWTGCDSVSTTNCNLTLNSNTTIAANYTTPPVAVLPNPAAATIGSQLQFTAKISGATSSAVTWSVAAPAGSSLSPGTISSSGLYTTPYPAPATVTVTATSTQNTANKASVAVTLNTPAKTSGPALSVDSGNQTHAISHYIYGWNAYGLDNSAAKAANITINRWGGDSTERYNYKLDVTSSMADWFFENQTGNGGDGWDQVTGVKAFDAMVNSDATNGFKTIGTVPVLGWVAKDSTSCSYPKSLYPNQLAVNNKPAFSTDGRDCGSGVYPDGVAGCTNSNGCNIPANPTATSIAEPPPAPPAASAVDAAWAAASWTGGWTQYLVSKFGSASNGGVAFYDLDNEPSWWDANDMDVHPLPFTYDEVTNGGIGTALAIKTIDPTAAVNGPVLDFWYSYFYSMKDIRNGWSNGNPCWQPWSNPIDREAHGGVPFMEYYLQQFKTAETTYGIRLLDYLDLHTYFVASYNGNSLAFSTAGDTGAQQARLNSTRVFWDPTYTDPNLPQPNYITDSDYTASCNVPLHAPQVIPMMQGWIAKDYPGTKSAITEYNWGGQESINGALAQADLLGIFGAYGLDLATLWGPPDPATQVPGLMAYEIYRNYDGNKHTFGDMALASTSANQAQLSVYGALRTGDSNLTVVVINKTYGDLTSTLSLPGLPASATSGQAYFYSNANLNAIAAQPAVTVTPGSGGAAGAIANYTFPAQSITLFVIPM